MKSTIKTRSCLLLIIVMFSLPQGELSAQDEQHRLVLRTHESALVSAFPLALWINARFYRPDSNYHEHLRGWKNPVDETARKILHDRLFQDHEQVPQKISDYLLRAIVVYPLLYFPRKSQPTYEFHDQPLSSFDDAKFFFSYVEAQGLTLLVTQVAKIVFDRHRPWLAYENVSAPMYVDAPRETANVSFFSGHTSAVFAAASFHHRMIQRFQGGGLHNAEVWGPYLAATLVGLARISADKHYLTDVITGAIIGTLVARWVVDLSDYTISDGGGPSLQRLGRQAIPIVSFNITL